MIKRYKPEPGRIDDGISAAGVAALGVCLFILCLTIAGFLMGGTA